MACETQPLSAIVAKIIETRRNEVRINPSWIATEALLEIDPDKVSLPLVYLGCHLELRQIARGLLRQHFEEPPSPADDALHSMTCSRIFSGVTPQLDRRRRASPNTCFSTR